MVVVDREGEIVTARVQRHAKGNVIMELGKAEAVMPPKSRAPAIAIIQICRSRSIWPELKKEERGPRLIRIALSTRIDPAALRDGSARNL